MPSLCSYLSTARRVRAGISATHCRKSHQQSLVFAVGHIRDPARTDLNTGKADLFSFLSELDCSVLRRSPFVRDLARKVQARCGLFLSCRLLPHALPLPSELSFLDKQRPI